MQNSVKAQPANDNCSSAQIISVPYDSLVCVLGTLTNATDDGLFSNCEIAGSQEVWYKYTVPGINNVISVAPAGANPATNLAISISNTGCTSYTADCNAASTPHGTATINRMFQAGSAIWIYVSSNGGVMGDFNLCIRSYTDSLAPGKTCETAINLCSTDSFTAPVVPGSLGFQPPCFSVGPMQQPAIYKFTVGKSGLLNWLATPTCAPPHASNTEFDWAVYDITNGCPGALVACNYNYTASFFESAITCSQGMQGGPGTGCYYTNSSSVNGDTLLEICNGVIVDSGSTYVIMVDQYTTGNSCNIHFDFTGSTFAIQGIPFSATQMLGCADTNVLFIPLDTVEALWNFGRWPNDTMTIDSAIIIPYSPGVYSINVSGGECVSNRNIIINPSLNIAVNNDTICIGDTATLLAICNDTLGTYNWYPNNTANSNSISVAPTADIMFTVTYNTGTCSTSASANVKVMPAVAADIIGPPVICTGTNAVLTANVGPNYNYTWSNGLTAPSITVSPTAATTYSVTVSNTYGCSSSDTISVTLGAAPVISINAPQRICEGDTVLVNVNGGNTYQWSSGLGTNHSISVMPLNTTTYTVTAFVDQNCSASSAVTINVYPASNTFINTNICPGSSYAFYGLNISQSGIYTHLSQTVNGCDSLITLHAYVVDSLPIPIIVRADDTLSTVQPYLHYQWLWNGNAQNSDTLPLLVINFQGSYVVWVTDSFGCTAASIPFIVTNVDIDDVGKDESFLLYPNPNTGNFAIEFADNQLRTVEVTDVMGRQVLLKTIAERKHVFNIYETTGLYFVTIKSRDKVDVVKVSLVNR